MASIHKIGIIIFIIIAIGNTNLCQVQNCLHCVINNPNVCSSCENGYQQSNSGICYKMTYCGDGICVPAVEQCDDGNMFNMDGCSYYCKIQQNFDCNLPAPPAKPLSNCSYTKPINFNIENFQKLQGENKVKSQMQLSPKLKLFQTIDFHKLVSTDLPISNYQFEYNIFPGSLSMVLTYQKSIQNLQATFTINPPQQKGFYLTPSSSKKVIMKSIDNQGLYFYSESDYLLAKSLGIATLVLTASIWLIFMLGLYVGKTIVVEMFAVFQISFLGLLVIEKKNPMLAALNNLLISNGFDKYVAGNHSSIQGFSQTFYELGLGPIFFNNFNISLFLFATPLLVALITFILSKTVYSVQKYEQKRQLMVKLYTKAIGQYTFLALIISGYIISISIVLQITYKSIHLNHFTSYVSIVQCTLLSIAFVAYFILLIVKPDIFGQFKSQFDPNSKLSYFTYNYFLIQRLVIGLLFGFLYFFKQILILTMLILFAEALFFVCKRPYNKIRHCYRIATNNLVSMAILGIYTYYVFEPQTTSTSEVGMYLPIVVIILLICCCTLNTYFIIESILIQVKQNRQIQEKQEPYQLEMTNIDDLKKDLIINIDYTPYSVGYSNQQNQKSIAPIVQKLDYRSENSQNCSKQHSQNYTQFDNEYYNPKHYDNQIFKDIKQHQQYSDRSKQQQKRQKIKLENRAAF